MDLVKVLALLHEELDSLNAGDCHTRAVAAGIAGGTAAKTGPRALEPHHGANRQATG